MVAFQLEVLRPVLCSLNLAYPQIVGQRSAAYYQCTGIPDPNIVCFGAAVTAAAVTAAAVTAAAVTAAGIVAVPGCTAVAVHIQRALRRIFRTQLAHIVDLTCLQNSSTSRTQHRLVSAGTHHSQLHWNAQRQCKLKMKFRVHKCRMPEFSH